MASAPTGPPTDPDPPTGSPLFRLLHVETDFVIYMRSDMTDAAPVYDVYEDQYFSMKDVPKKPGQVLLIGNVVRMVLYSRDKKPYVGKAGGGGIYEDKYVIYLSIDV